MKRNILYEREKEYPVVYKDIILPHKFYADFVIQNKIILEVKSKSDFAKEDTAQTINYLRLSNCRLGILVNFGTSSLQYKRVVL